MTKKKAPEDLLARGRPSIYSDELALEICERLALGQSLNAICKDSLMPTRSTVNLWLFNDKNPLFSDNYAVARARQQDYFADEILEIADDCAQDAEIKFTKSGNPYISENWQSVNRAKERIKTRQWLMGRIAPKKYGERVQIDAQLDIHLKEVSWDTGPKRLNHAAKPLIKAVVNEAPSQIDRSVSSKQHQPSTKPPYQL